MLNKLMYIILGIWLFFHSQVYAETFIVDPQGAGDFSSIQEAIDSDRVIAGDTILVMPGTYKEQILINKSITLKALKKYTPTVIAYLEGAKDPYTFIRITANAVKVEGFTIYPRRQSTAIKGTTVSDCIITQNKILGQEGVSATGISISNARNNEVSFNIIEGGSLGIGLSGPTTVGAYANRILYNRINREENSGTGISISGSCNFIKGNILQGENTGLRLDGGDAWWFDYNTIAHNVITGAYYGGGVFLRRFVFASHNQFYGNTFHAGNGFEVEIAELRCYRGEECSDDVCFCEGGAENFVADNCISPGYFDSSYSDKLPCSLESTPFPYGNYWDNKRCGVNTETLQSGKYLVYAKPYRIASVYSQDNFPLVDDPNPIFSRGNANNDKQIDLADAVFILTYLFAGGTNPQIPDALDTNDDGTLTLADPIYLLNHLFVNPEAYPIPYPYPEDGLDPTEDSLGCGGGG